jgi:uncharacterized damage-inducible protein DinB
VGPHWIEAFRYHRWANMHVLTVCAGLAEDQLELTTTGTYGTIAKTLLHMVGAEQRYVARLGGGEPAIGERDEFPGLAAIRAHATRSADRLIELAETVPPEPPITAKFRDGQYRLNPGIVLLQALHHGNDHRTHICTILGAHGIEYGDMDLWAYGEDIGALVRVSD